MKGPGKERLRMGSRRVYRQRRYEFGQRLFDLRTRLAFTQGQLAEQIGVHWHSVQKWETGESYPKAETLQRLITVCLHHQAFTVGKEREEAESLWQQVSEDGQRRLASFDHAWFTRTLALTSQSVALPEPIRQGGLSQGRQEHRREHDWREMPTLPEFFGRTA
jgi:transcriptional regulator with XRE-family HTH domain